MRKRLIGLIAVLAVSVCITAIVAYAGLNPDITPDIADDWTVTFDAVEDASSYDIQIFYDGVFTTAVEEFDAADKTQSQVVTFTPRDIYKLFEIAEKRTAIEDMNKLGIVVTAYDKDLKAIKDSNLTDLPIRIASTVKLMPADENTSTMIERNGIVETLGTTDISMAYGVKDVIKAFDYDYQETLEYSVSDISEYEEWFVYGINTTSALTVGTLSQVVKISGDGYWKLYDSQGTEITNMPSKRFGTKCKIEVYDTKTNTLVESFRIVYYGDIDSKANVNATDITYFLQELEYRTWSLRTGKAFVPCLTRAACLSQKKNFSSGDVSLLYAVVVDHTMVIDQRTGQAVKTEAK